MYYSNSLNSITVKLEYQAPHGASHHLDLCNMWEAPHGAFYHLDLSAPDRLLVIGNDAAPAFSSICSLLCAPSRRMTEPANLPYTPVGWRSPATQTPNPKPQTLNPKP